MKSEQIREQNAEYMRLFQLGRDLTDIPVRRKGKWEVVHQEQRDGEIKTALVHDERGEVMTNANDEIHDAASFAASACGRVLVLGLGLGLVVRLLLARDQVDEVAVVEVEPDVVVLVGSDLLGGEHEGRLHIRTADAYSPEVVEQFTQWRPQSVFADTFDNADERTHGDRQKARELWEPVTQRLVIWQEERSRIAMIEQPPEH